jgi:hypothetical protein
MSMTSDFFERSIDMLRKANAANRPKSYDSYAMSIAQVIHAGTKLEGIIAAGNYHFTQERIDELSLYTRDWPGVFNLEPEDANGDIAIAQMWDYHALYALLNTNMLEANLTNTESALLVTKRIFSADDPARLLCAPSSSNTTEDRVCWQQAFIEHSKFLVESSLTAYYSTNWPDGIEIAKIIMENTIASATVAAWDHLDYECLGVWRQLKLAVVTKMMSGVLINRDLTVVA